MISIKGFRYHLLKFVPERIKTNLKNNISFGNYLKWFLTRPKLPQGQLYMLHLGCGDINVPGFINIDKRPFSHVHYLSGVEKLPFIRNNTIDLIYISHCLEHIPHGKIENVLNEYNRVLKSGGILRISVPNFHILSDIYNETEDLNNILHPLFGSQEHKYNFHFSTFDYKSLESLLIKNNFKDIKLWKYGENDLKSIPDWSGKTVIFGEKVYSISLNVEAQKV